MNKASSLKTGRIVAEFSMPAECEETLFHHYLECFQHSWTTLRPSNTFDHLERHLEPNREPTHAFRAISTGESDEEEAHAPFEVLFALRLCLCLCVCASMRLGVV
jgi:hypothetical protein